MSAINDGGPAFPMLADVMDADGRPLRVSGVYDGMTLRDYFATHASEHDVVAMAEVIRANTPGGIGVLPDNWRTTARYMHADAMLAARSAAVQHAEGGEAKP